MGSGKPPEITVKEHCSLGYAEIQIKSCKEVIREYNPEIKLLMAKVHSFILNGLWLNVSDESLLLIYVLYSE